jgi:ligand-binding sensor domain-containing protein
MNPNIISLLALVSILFSAPAFAVEREKTPSTTGSLYPHILETETYTLNARNVKVLKSAGPHLWMGTSMGALLYDTGTAEDYRVIDNKNGLLSNGVFAIAFDGKGTPWIGTYGGGLSRLEKKRGWVNYNTPHGLCDAFVYDVEFDQDTLWIATWSGVNRVRGDLKKKSSWETFTVENTGGGLIDNWVYAIEIGKDGRIWFGTESGISLFDGKRWRGWNHTSGLGASHERVKQANAGEVANFSGAHHQPGLPAGDNHGAPSAPGLVTPFAEHTGHRSPTTATGDEHSPGYRPNYVVAMLLDSQNRLWIGTWGAGLSLFDTRTLSFRNFTTQDGLPGNYILALKEDPAGKLWIGSNNGLSRFDGKEFTNFSTLNGLISDRILSIEIDSRRFLWAGGLNGMSRLQLNPQTLEPVAKN